MIARFRSSSKSPTKNETISFRALDHVRERKPRASLYLTVGQTVTISLICASFATLATSITFLFSRGTHVETSELPALVALRGQKLVRSYDHPLVLPALKSHERIDTGIRPRVAWLMSFPNSGTSFTLHMTREASNCTTATNYGLEGDIKDKPSVQAIPGDAGKNGPFLELIPDRHTNVPETILTKTHCKAFCSGSLCGTDNTIHTARSFMKGCLSGFRGVETDHGLDRVKVTYNASLVGKAIHIFRHPLDNIVARFHLEYNVQRSAGNSNFGELYPKNSTGFRQWCADDDKNTDLINSRFIDPDLRTKMESIPCRNDFYRYVSWHNNAFYTTTDLDIPTLIVHYGEYSTDFEATRDKILNWLDLPRNGEGIEFHSGKIYRSYYTLEERLAIRDFIKEFASVPTWHELKGYDFSTDDGPRTSIS